MEPEPGPDAPSYEEMVKILSYLADSLAPRAGQGSDRLVRDLHASLQSSLDAALRLEWAAQRGAGGQPQP